MKISDLIHVLETFAPPQLQEEYDNCGLITGQSSWNCSGVLCTLDITMAVLEEAVQRQCNLVVAHHPIIFKGLKKINGNNGVEAAVIYAIKNDIALYAAHTNMDNVVAGVNGMIAKKLHLQQTTILQPKPKALRCLVTFAPVDKAAQVREALFKAGAGYVGKYSECSFNSEGTGTFKAEAGADPYIGQIGERHYEKEAKIEVVYPFYMEARVIAALMDHHPYEEVAHNIFTMDNVQYSVGAGLIGYLPDALDEEAVLQQLKSVFTCGVIRHTRLLGKPVKKIAVCGGAGSFLIKEAIRQGADLYLTGDVKYHEFFEAENKLVIADIGHYESEQYTVELFYNLLVEKFPTFAVLKSGVNTNPVHYYS